MAHPAPSIGHYQFGVFTVDARAFELRKRGVRMKLQERPLQLLLLLLERPGHIVTREVLRQRLWGDGTFVDFDHSISSAVNKLRAALGDSAQHPRYIETVGRQGYRFIYPVAPHQSTLSVLPTPRPALVGRTGPPRRRWFAAGLIVVLMLAAVGTALLLVRRYRGPGQVRSIAVLPLKNLSSDPEQVFFTEGLTDELTTRLTDIDDLRVTSRTSVLQYKGSTKPLPQIARELGVDAVVEGSVQRSGNRVRITAELISAADDRHLWAASYDRDVRDVLALQDEVAHEVADNIRLTLVAANPRPSTHSVDPETFQLYLRARYEWAKRNPVAIHNAIVLYDKALERDPNYALAWAGKAQCYALLGGYTAEPQEGFVRKARAAALRALELDSQLAEAHLALAVIAQNYDWDWRAAEREYRDALRLDGNNPTAHHWYAEFLAFQGRFDEAFTQIGRAEQLDPSSAIIQTDHGAILIYARDYGRAEEVLRGVLARTPEFPRARGLLETVYILENRADLALADLAQLPEYKGLSNSWKLAATARVYAGEGRYRDAERMIERLRKLDRAQQFDAVPMIFATTDGRHNDEAFAWLEVGYQQHSDAIAALKVNPAYGPVRGDPRYTELLHRVGLDK